MSESNNNPEAPAPETPDRWIYASPPEEERRRLASALLAGTVFTSLHVNRGDEELIRSIFLPLIFGALRGATPEHIKEIRPVIYEYLSEAGPLSVNGYPSFMSMRIISEADFVEVGERAKRAQEALG